MKRKFSFTGESFDRVRSYLGNLRGTKEDDGEENAEAPETKTEEPEKPASGLVSASRTDIGKLRESNQDAVIDAAPLFGVCDGMGGHKAGDVASSTAKDLLISLLTGKKPDPDALKTAVEAVNRRLYMKQEEDSALSGMGTTMTVLWAAPEKMLLAHVGDSRCYLLRGGELKQVSRDHSLVAEMVREGLLTPEQAACHPMRNVITRAVGTDRSVEVDITEELRQKGDVWLICSDGLHGMVEDEKLRETLLTHAPEEAADLLLQAALEAGGRDNISLAIVLDTGEAGHD